MFMKHSDTSIKDSMAQGLTHNEAWLRGLRLEVAYDSQETSLEGIEFSCIKLTNQRGEKFILMPVITSCFIGDDGGRIVVSFEHEIKEIIDMYGETEEITPSFDIEKFFEDTRSVSYEMEATEEVDPELFEKMSDAEFTHPDYTLDTTCVMTLEVYED